MSDDGGRPGQGRDLDRDFRDDPIDLRALFGSDFEALAAEDADTADAAGAEIPDISAADAALVRAVLSADVDAVPPGPTTEAIVAAARASRAAEVADPAGVEDVAGVARAGGLMGTARGGPELQEPDRSDPNADFERGELAARRRRRWSRGLLAAAGVAAVLVIAVPVALKLGGDADQTSAASMAAPAATSTMAGDAASSEMAAGASAGSGDAAGGDDGAERTAGAGSESAGARNPVPAAPDSRTTSAAAAASDAESSAAGSSAAGVPPPASSASAAGPGAPMASVPPGRTGDSQDKSTADDAGICTWTELPVGAAALAKASFAGVVGVPRPLATECAPGRVSGGTFPASDGSRGGVTVQVVTVGPVATGSSSVGSGPARAPCASEGCRPEGAALFSAAEPNVRTVWLYADGQQIRVTASTGLGIDDAALEAFARGLSDLVR